MYNYDLYYNVTITNLYKILTFHGHNQRGLTYDDHRFEFVDISST